MYVCMLLLLYDYCFKLFGVCVLQTVTPSAPSEIVEMILLSSSRMVASGLWKANNEQAVANTYRLLATVCHDWWSLLRQRFFQRSLRSALRSIGPTIHLHPPPHHLSSSSSSFIHSFILFKTTDNISQLIEALSSNVLFL